MKRGGKRIMNRGGKEVEDNKKNKEEKEKNSDLMETAEEQ